MKVTCVTVFVKPDHIQDFISATIENRENSIKEPGNLRFDFLQCSTDPLRFFLYEAYETEEAASAHKETLHYKKWKTTVENWMARPREGIAHQVIRPQEKSSW